GTNSSSGRLVLSCRIELDLSSRPASGYGGCMSTMPQTQVGPIRDERSQGEQRSPLWAGVLAAAPLAVAFAGFGAAFGSLARAAGVGPTAPVVLSATAFAGSAQFAAVAVLAAGGSVAAAVVAAVLLNARYGPVGLSVAPVVGGR